MNTLFTLPLAHVDATLEQVGGKGTSLARLASAGLPVPDGFHVVTEAYRRFVADNDLQSAITKALGDIDPARPAMLDAASDLISAAFRDGQMPGDVAGAIVSAYASLPGQAPAVAVRSSATAEDLPDASFAGQQETFLNVSGPSELLVAVQRCWASLWTARAIGYRARQGLGADGMALAVVVQLLVPAEASGIMFTANPTNGRRDQVLINASWGLGEAIVSGQVTPDSLTLRKADAVVTERNVADKHIMTVRVNGSTAEQPVPETLRRVPSMTDEVAAELTRLGVQIEALYGVPMDIEWTLADGRLAIVQARPITAMASLLPEPPSEWPLPVPGGQFLRTSIVDLMPDPLTPLFGSMGVSAINAGLVRLVRWMTHRNDVVFPAETMVPINGYAYVSGKYSGREVWFMMVHMLPSFPGMLRKGISHWRDEIRPQYLHVIDRWREREIDEMESSELLAACRDLLAAAVDLVGSLMASTMGPSAGSEMAFTRVYEKLVRRAGDPAPPTFLMGYDSVPILSEKSLYDLSTWCQTKPTLSAYLLQNNGRTIIRQLQMGQPPAEVDAIDWQAFADALHQHLDRYGHIIYDLDFGKALPLDDPAPMLETLRMYLQGKGTDPYARQSRLEEERERATETVTQRTRGLRGWALRKTLGWAQRQAQVRENGMADIGLGYPLLRSMLHELGVRLSAAGAVANPDDVYWLTEEELSTAVRGLDHQIPLEDHVQAIAERRGLWQARKQVTPPPMLPPKKKYMGMDVDMFIAAQEDQSAKVLKGVGASPGRVTGTACVLHGPDDFGRMEAGAVLVAPITTPAWTPLFAMASAIVTDVGGPLSHGSIVAREYGIPAVLGTGAATRRFVDGQRITVDGSAGTVTLAA